MFNALEIELTSDLAPVTSETSDFGSEAELVQTELLPRTAARESHPFGLQVITDD